MIFIFFVEALLALVYTPLHIVFCCLLRYFLFLHVLAYSVIDIDVDYQGII